MPCPVCGNADFRRWRQGQVCCSRSCARKHAPAFLAHLRSVSRKGGLAAGAKRRAETFERWSRECAGMTADEVAHVAYRRGYRAGLGANSQRQFARGYEAALRDTDLSRKTA